MEVALGVGFIVVTAAIAFVIALVISKAGKAVGPPEPASLTDEALWKRRSTELDWLVKYSDMPLRKKQDPELKRMHDEKDAYLGLLTLELNRRTAEAKAAKSRG